MKRYISAVLAATMVALLTACGGGSPQAAPTASETFTTSPSPTTMTPRPVADVAGKTFVDARTMLGKQGFSVAIVGPDGKKWNQSAHDHILMAVSTNPAAGVVTDVETILIHVNFTEGEFKVAAEAAAATAKKEAEAAAATAKKEAEAAALTAQLATRYTYTCGVQYDYKTPSDRYYSYKDVWTSKHYASSNTCTIKINGVGVYDHPVLLPSEQAIADVVAAHGGGGGGSPSSDFGHVLQLCVKLEADYADKLVARMDWKKAEAQGALTLCPDAPHAAVLQEVVTAVKIGDGTKVVGQTMEPGTYQTKPSAKDCYWSRTTGGGDIIDNDFVGYAPNGVTVTVYAGEGFESQRCGVWTKIG